MVNCRIFAVGWARCRPMPTISWSRSGRTLSTGEDRHRYSLSEGKHTLHISKLTFEDDGQYRCNASNGVGSRLFSIDLRVYSTILTTVF